jgi:putative ABC transport system substrate-binding protein
MKRREFIAGLGSVAASPAVWAQQPEPVRRIGVLMAFAASDPEAQLRVSAFEAGLRDLGWTKGRNLRIEYRWAPNEPDLLRVLAAELVAMAPDLILGVSTPVLAALLKESTTIPMVFVQVTDPVGSGFVPNLARPGGNITGFTNFEFSMGGKWLQTLKEIEPRLGVWASSSTRRLPLMQCRSRIRWKRPRIPSRSSNLRCRSGTP